MSVLENFVVKPQQRRLAGNSRVQAKGRPHSSLDRMHAYLQAGQWQTASVSAANEYDVDVGTYLQQSDIEAGFEDAGSMPQIAISSPLIVFSLGDGFPANSNILPQLDYIYLPLLPLPNLAGELLNRQLQYAEPVSLHSFEVLDQLIKLDDGWDGDGSIGPSDTVKSVAAEVFSRLASYVTEAETEVDASTGEVTLTWFLDGGEASVSVNVLPNGRVVVVTARIDRPSQRTELGRDELGRLERVVIDAGLGRLHG
jgi:hypothetical protein